MQNALKYLVPACLVVVGVIHLIPLSGVLGAERLLSLYGVGINGPDLAILMRHRAVLFGLLGTLCLYAAFRPRLQLLGLIAGAVSVCSFLYLAWATGEYNAELQRVVVADLVALVALVFGFAGFFLRRPDKMT